MEIVSNLSLSGRQASRWTNSKVGETYLLQEGIDFEKGKEANLKSSAAAWAKNQKPTLMARTRTVKEGQVIKDAKGNQLKPGLYVWFELRPEPKSTQTTENTETKETVNA